MLSTRIQASLFIGSLLLAFAPGLARADEAPAAPHFGDAGQIALQLNEGLSVSDGDIISGPQIQANYFIAPHLSLGLMAGVNYLSSSVINGGGDHELVFRVGPRIGYDLAISEHVSFWPQVGVDLRDEHESSSASGTVETPGGGATTTSFSDSTTITAFGFAAVAPIIIHPTQGFFIGAGPSLYTEFSNKTSTGGQSADNSKVTSVGLMATIGGAF